MDSNVIRFDKPTAIKFKKTYEEAVNLKKEYFSFNGNEFLTVYAKYVLEYLTLRFKKL